METSQWLVVLGLALLQNLSFSMVSRARNRSSTAYHLLTSIFSNGVWFLTFRELVLTEFSPALFTPYTVGTCAGSLLGTKVSMWIERLIGAASDSHLSPK